MKPLAKLAFLLALIGSQISHITAQGGYRYAYFVGVIHGKAFFTLSYTYDWLESMDMCLSRGMYSATIENADENALVANYLTNTTDIPASSSFWLPATDFVEEGNFAWVQNKEPVAYANWTTGYPSANRTRNCVIVKADGSWHEEVCSADFDKEHHYVLCMTPLHRVWSRVEDEDAHELKVATRPTAALQAFPVALTRETYEQVPSRIIPIGNVGTKFYFKDETLTMRKFGGQLNYCHAMGMRLVNPETDEERDFLVNYSQQLAESGEDPLFMTAGTDMLSTSCNGSNTLFRSFYSGASIEDDKLFHDNIHYKCARIVPGGYSPTDCIGQYTWTICELNSP